MPSKTLSYTRVVSQNEIDALEHVNNIQYLQFVQDAAEKHWTSLSNAAVDGQYVWVVIRHEIDYLIPAKLNDELTIKTWIGESAGAKSERFVEIYRKNKVMSSAKTIWCLLDKRSMRPVRIPHEIMDILYKP